MQSVRWLVELARKAGVERIVLNGRFVADTHEPNDADCVLLISPNTARDRDALEELDKGLPFLDIALLERDDFARMVEDFFAADRCLVVKGMVEVISWEL